MHLGVYFNALDGSSLRRSDSHVTVISTETGTIVANKKVALSALGENLLRKVVKKVDNAKITTYATTSGRNNTK